MKKFEITPIVKRYYKTKWYPRFYYYNPLFRGLDRGIYMTWFNKMIVFVRPINERN